MATKEELAREATVASLKELAAEKEVDLEGATKKDDIVEILVASRRVTRADIEALIEEDDEDEDVETTDEADEAEDDEDGDEDDEEDDEDEAPTAEAADLASPTGGANTAGTPQSQLDQAPPMQDPSGSNVPAPNLRQPVAEGALGESAGVAPESLDPALMDPEKAAVERVEGRTSDAANRDAGVHIDEVPPDINAGSKPSDGGPERYPFPQGGDVEVATVPKTDGKGEYWPALEIEDAVVLGEHASVPERLQGRRAFVTDAPRYLIPKGEEDKVWISVKTRDEVNASLTIPLSAVKAVEKGGRASVTVRG